MSTSTGWLIAKDTILANISAVTPIISANLRTPSAISGSVTLSASSVFVMIAALSLISTLWAQGDRTKNRRESKPLQTVNDSRMVAPALEKYAQDPLAELWKRPGLTPRDRSILTNAAQIARN